MWKHICAQVSATARRAATPRIALLLATMAVAAPPSHAATPRPEWGPSEGGAAASRPALADLVKPWEPEAPGGAPVRGGRPAPDDSREFQQSEGFLRPCSVSANRADGSCWAADMESAHVVHLAADGSELLRKDGLLSPTSLSVNATDGSCSGSMSLSLSRSTSQTAPAGWPTTTTTGSFTWPQTVPNSGGAASSSVPGRSLSTRPMAPAGWRTPTTPRSSTWPRTVSSCCVEEASPCPGRSRSIRLMDRAG